MRRSFLGIGLLMLSIGIASIASPAITGYSIAENYIKFLPSIFGIVFIGLGILMIMAGDALQEHLRKKEEESPSPSLEEGRGRKLKRGFWRRFFPKLSVERVEPRTDLSRGSNYQYDSENWKKDFDERERRKLLGYQTGSIRRLRDKGASTNTGIRALKMKLEEAMNSAKYGVPPKRAEILGTLDALSEAYKKIGMSFPKEKYLELFERKAMEGGMKEMERIPDYVRRNEDAVSPDAIIGKMNRASQFFHIAGKDITPSGRQKFLDEMKMLYAKEARTLPISEVATKYGVTFVHGIPYGPAKNARIDQSHLTNNEFWNKKMKEGTVRMDDITARDFLNNLFNERPDLSASAVKKDSSPWAFFAPYGVIFKEGKIYDASPLDLSAIGETDKELVRMRGSQYGERTLEGRIEGTINPTAGGSKSSWNEFIIGDNYEIKGLFYVEGHPHWNFVRDYKSHDGRGKREKEVPYAPEAVAEIAKYAIERGLPLYRFRQGEGFTEVNPQDYLDTRRSSAAEPTKTRKSRKKMA